MKNLKKLIAVVLTFTLVFSAMAVGFAGTFSDVKDDASYAGAVARLSSLGLVSGMPDGTYNPDGAVTRAQMIAFVNAAKGLQDAAKVAAGPTKFSDVPANYWASGDINIANPDGYPDGTFKPDNTVTYPEALALLLRALGVTENLSWPYGVIAKAADIGLTDGVTLSANATINRGQMAVLVNNALDLPLYTYNSDGVLTEKKDSNGNVIKLISKVATPTDYVVKAAANQTDIAAGKVLLNDGKNDVVKNAGDIDFSKYVGKSVKVYYTKTDVPVLVTENTNNIKEYDGAKIDTTGAVYDSDGNVVKVSDKIVTVKDLPILYNGYLTNWNAIDSNIVSKVDVKLIDNNNDKSYEYAVVTGYDNADHPSKFVTANVADGAKYIATDSGNYTLVKSDGTAYHYTVVGDVSKLTDIKANDVVYYGKQYDADGNQVGVYLNVVRKTVTGKVTEVSDKIKVGDKAYSVADGSTYTTSKANVGDEGTFVLDKDGKIFRYLGKTTATGNYAIVLAGSYVSDGSKLSSKLELLTADGKDTVYAWDGTNTDSNALKSDANNKNIKGTLVKYDINSDKTVVSNVYENGTTDNIKNDNLTFTYDATTRTFTETSSVLSGSDKFYAGDNTVVFAKNSDGSYSVVKLADVTSNKTTPGYSVSGIAFDGFHNVKAIVFTSNSFTATDTTKVDAYITNIVKVTTADGSFSRITAFVNGDSKTYDATKEFTTVQKGNVYVLTVDNKTGKVTDVGDGTTSGVKINPVAESVYTSDINTVDMTIKNAAGTSSYVLASGYQVIEKHIAKDGTVSYLAKYVSDISSEDGFDTTNNKATVNLYLDPSTGKVAFIEYTKTEH